MQTRLLKSFACFGLLFSLGTGCSGGLGDADFPPMAKRWYDRGLKSYLAGDLEDASVSVENALRVAPNQPDTRLLAGRVALATLEYDRALEVLKGLDSLDARGLRGRALWYKGDVQHAADELEALVADPDVRDPWAVEIIKLARRGQGRKPFEMRGGMVAVSEMPRTGTPSMIVPLEINGDPAKNAWTNTDATNSHATTTYPVTIPGLTSLDPDSLRPVDTCAIRRSFRSYLAVIAFATALTPAL